MPAASLQKETPRANKVAFRQGGPERPAPGYECRRLPVSGGRGSLCPPPPSTSHPQRVIYGNCKTVSKQAPSVPAVMEEYLCDKFTASLEDPLIFWEMTRHLWPRCVKFPLLYPRYMPWTIYLESEGIFTIQGTTSQAVKEIYSE